MISIIIPTLNEEDYLPLLLKSIRKQGFTDYEIIVSDAGSEDKTREIAKKYGCEIVSGGMPAKGRNEGAKIAKGDLFFFIDADSILPDNFFSKLIKEFKKRKLDLASFPVYPQGNLIDKVLYGIYNLFAWATQRFLSHATQTILIKREIHQKIGGFDEEIKIGEDHAYAREGAKFGKFGFLLVTSILTSARRFERDGRLKTYLVYLLAGIYMFFFGKVKSRLFNYYYSRKKKNLGNF
jgi:glycosyltransferase involved in cell wall biosynthesis